MNRRDREYWATARTLEDLAARNAAWLRGKLSATPVHAEPPGPDLRPFATLLVAVNRAGFLADGVSRLAESRRCAAVAGLADDEALAALREAVDPAGLLIGVQPVHRGIIRAYATWCHPDAAQAVREAWQVAIVEPDPDGEPALWRALDQFAQSAPPVAWGVAS
jgi:hypothetical protein